MSVDPAALDAACASGTELAVIAANSPHRVALTIPADTADARTVSFAELEAGINRLARGLRQAGLNPGDGLGLLCSNRIEWIETFWATLRTGLRLIPINWHLEREDVRHVLTDSGARALLAEAQFSALVPDDAVPEIAVSVGGDIGGFESFEGLCSAQSPDLIDDPVLGSMMIYTSGTTGRPKGVSHATPDPQARTSSRGMAALFDFRPDADDLMLCTAPLYHSGPSRICNEWPLGSGIGVLLMDRFDPVRTLEMIQNHRVTHAFMVPTMFHRLLALPRDVRESYDLSSLRFVLHGAAPTTVESKSAMMEWFGPILHEIFAATEGPGTWISPDEWLAHPGSVGRANPEAIRILADDGSAAEPDAEGIVHFRSQGQDGFKYHDNAAGTEAAHDPTGDWFTVGDRGRVDADGYLYLTGRTAEVIISGGVNIYPSRIDEALLDHAGVVDACSFGAPDPDLGEVVKAHVVIADGFEVDGALEQELIDHCTAAVGRQMSPRGIAFVDSLPRSEAGKLYRQRVRAPYWTT